jgi:hypothetical protein
MMEEWIIIDEIMSLVFLVIAAWYGLCRLFRALWEYDNSNGGHKKGVDNDLESWYNEYNK